jgi:dTDP-4-amino-4,6-dideoxygalactose transaminase
VRARLNAERLSARLAELPGVEPPCVPSDRTHVYHKYRVRLDPQVAGIALGPAELRDRVLAELRAEGVEAVLWQRLPLPVHPLFSSAGSYPNAVAVLESSIVIGSQTYPLFAQPLDVIDEWADAFERVWKRLRS